MQENSNSNSLSPRETLSLQLEMSCAKKFTAYFHKLLVKYSPFLQFYHPSFISRLSYLLWQPNSSQIIRKHNRHDPSKSSLFTFVASPNMAPKSRGKFSSYMEMMVKIQLTFFSTKQFHVIKSARINILNPRKARKNLDCFTFPPKRWYKQKLAENSVLIQTGGWGRVLLSFGNLCYRI